MKKPELKYPETFIAERVINGVPEYSFAIRRKFLWWYWKELCGLHNISSNSKESQWEMIDGVEHHGEYFHRSPHPVKEAIDNLRKDVYGKYQKKLKTWERNQKTDIKYTKYP